MFIEMSVLIVGQLSPLFKRKLGQGSSDEGQRIPRRMSPVALVGSDSPVGALTIVTSWFAEGFETPDLQEARLLLNQQN